MADITIDENTTPGDLRAAYEKQKARADAAEKRAGELAAKDRSSTVAELLKAKGVEGAAKAASVYPSDKAADEASVNAWIEENKDFLRITEPKSSTDSAAQSTASGTPGETPQNDPNAMAAQLVALATAASGQADSLPQRIQGAPAIDVDQMQQLLTLMENTPRTPEGYALLARSGIFPTDPGMV